MEACRSGWRAAVFAAVLTLMTGGPARAGEGPENELLKKHGLKIVGALAVLETESDIKNKLNEARRLAKQLNYSLMQQRGTLSPKEIQQTIKGLGDQINQIRSQINLANQQISRFPRFRGRIANNIAQEQYAELVMYRTQLQMELSQETAWLNQLKSQQSDPKSKDTIDAEVRDRREAIHQALLDVRKLVDQATEKYTGLATDEEVKKALDALGKGTREKPKLGPSHDFVTNVKMLERLETAESAGEAAGAPAKSVHRSRGGTRKGRSSKSARGGAATGGSSTDPF